MKKEEIANLQEWLTKRNFKASISNESLKIDKLAIGATGENVVALQKWLKKYNFYTGEINGQFDDATEQAVKHFQNATGTIEDGWVGIQTLQAMKQWEDNKQRNSSENTQNNDSSKTVAPKSTDNYSPKKYKPTTNYKHYSTPSYSGGRGTGDCWVNSGILYNKLTSSGVKSRIIQYGTSLSPRHRSVQTYQNGGWVDYNYKANGYAKRYYATKNKPGMTVVE